MFSFGQDKAEKQNNWQTQVFLEKAPVVQIHSCFHQIFYAKCLAFSATPTLLTFYISSRYMIDMEHKIGNESWWGAFGTSIYIWLTVGARVIPATK